MKKQIFLMLFMITILSAISMVYGLGQRVCVSKIRNHYRTIGISVNEAYDLASQEVFANVTLTAMQRQQAARFWKSIKQMLVRDADRREVAADRLTLRQAVNVAFPDSSINWQDQRTRRTVNRFVLLIRGGDPNDL